MDVNATLPEERIKSEDMIIEIVARLPVKSVGRCRCVSPRWLSLFSDPGFAKLHLQVSRKLQSLIFQDSLQRIKTASFEEESLVVRDLEAPFDHKYLRFLGSCNGMVAVLDFNPEEGLFIWNPSTGFFKKLPSRLFPIREYYGGVDIMVGFGHASGSDEYKLVMDAEIYSSKTESWKPIKIPDGNYVIGNGVLCSGALHWLVESGAHLSAFDLEKEEFSMMELPRCDRIYDLVESGAHLSAFDLEKEEFSMMELPRWDRIYDFNVTCDGCLFVLAERQVPDCGGVVELWVMREYGKIGSWTRSLSVKIPTHPERKDTNMYKGVRAISVMETSAFVWTMYPGFPSTNKEEDTGFNTVDSDMYKGVVYKESLCCLA